MSEFILKIQKIFEDGNLVNGDVRDLITIRESPFDTMTQIRNIFGPNGTNIWCCRSDCHGCLPEGLNILEYLPKKDYEMKNFELRGPRCICKLWIDKMPE